MWAIWRPGRPGPRPCTPAGIIELLKRYQIPIRGKRAVVVGRSDIVGKPVALLLLHEDATVTICHSKTPDLAGVCRQADILVAAMGRAAMITADFIAPGATVIDVGINRIDNRDEAARIFRDRRKSSRLSTATAACWWATFIRSTLRRRREPIRPCPEAWVR